MGSGLLVARLVLAAVFAVAGVAKLADPAGSRRAVGEFGVPRALAGPLGTALPVMELAVAVALLPAVSAWWAAIGALGLLGAFIAVIGVNLARGRQPDCHCFGQLHSAPAGGFTLARNAVLAALAGFIVWRGAADPGPSVVRWLGGLAAAQTVTIILGIAVLALLALGASLLSNVLRQQGRLLLRLDALESRLGDDTGGAAPGDVAAEPAEGLPVGAPAPAFALSGLYGETLTLEALRARGRPIMLLFTDPNCGPCNGLLPEIGLWQREHAAELTLVLISRENAEANRPKIVEHGITGVLLQDDWEVGESYDTRGTPSAVIVAADGTVASPVAAGAEAIRSLLARTIGSPSVAVPSAPRLPTVPAANGSDNGSGNGQAQPAPPTLQVGDRAPALKLPNLNGRTVDLASFRGSDTLVLFWNPGCGFCNNMLDDLKAWEANRPKGTPKLVVISTGDVETNRAMGLRSPVLLDTSFAAGSAFGANGTPMAVLLDVRGRIAAPVAAGATGVFALAGGEPAGAES